MRLNEIEEIIRLIHNGFDLNLLSFELDVPMEEIQFYKEQLELRKTVNESIKSGKIQEAVEKLNYFINNSENNLIEKLMLLKLNAYIARTNINQDELKKLEKEKQEIGFSKSFDEVLEELKIHIPKRKGSNIRKKDKKNIKIDDVPENEESINEEVKEDEEESTINYEELINKYKEKISTNPAKSLNDRNLLAYTYYRAGKIDESRDELYALVEQCSSYTAYKQLVYLEKNENNFDDAKFWAYEAIGKFPNSVDIREQLISIARKENDTKEIIKQLKELINIDAGSAKNEKRLELISKVER